MDHQLVVLRGRSVSSAIKLADGMTTAGRHEECQLRIKSSQVSRKHCQFFEKNGMLLVKDLGSSNGTYVNSEKIDGQRVLEPGDEVGIGPITFRVEKIGAMPAPAAPAQKPGDTAITKGIAAQEAVPDDEFEIIFDEEPAAVEAVDLAEEPPVPVTVPPPVAASGPSGGGSLADSRKTTAPPAHPGKPSAPQPAPAAEERDLADDAVADFLLDLDLKVDDDD